MAILDFWSAQLAIFRSTGHPVPSVYVSTQIAQRFARSKKKMLFKMASMAAILDFQLTWF